MANFAYYRYEQVAPVVTKKVQEYEALFAKAVAAEDAQALDLWNVNRTADAVELLTAAAEDRADGLVRDWLSLYTQLFMDFRDGQTPSGVQAGYAQDWYDLVAAETGDRYLMPAGMDEALEAKKLAVVSKYRFYKK